MAWMVALLRGVNVGGRTRVPMAELRAIAAGLGLRDARTLLQSGNLLFRARSDTGADTAADLEAAVAARFGVRFRVLVRTGAELAAVAAANPFADGAHDPAKLHVLFLERDPTPERIASLDPDRSPPDEFAVVGREVYVRYPNGAGRSRLTAAYFERQLSTAATARNWNTVTRLLALTAGA